MNDKWKTDETDRKRIALIISLVVHLLLLYSIWFYDQRANEKTDDLDGIEQRTDLVRDQFLKS